MAKNKNKSKDKNGNGNIKPRLTLGQRLSDDIAEIGGSWGFIIGFFVFLIVWMIINSYLATKFDPYPFILLNLVLSCLAAIQAPIILMSQNRQTERDRTKSERDYAVNRKAEREVANMQRDLNEIKRLIKYYGQKGSIPKDWNSNINIKK